MLKKLTRESLVVSFIVAIFFTVFLTVSLHRYWQYSTWYYDFGIYYQTVAAIAQGREPIIDHFIFTDQNVFGDHFFPLILIISPFMAVFKTGEVMLVAQTLFVALSGFFVYLIGKEILKNKFEAISILIIYFSFLGFHNALITEFHPIVMLPLPLSIFFYAMIKKHKWAYFISLTGVLLIKETTFVIPAWFGLLIAFKNKGEWRKIGIFTTLFSVVYGLLVLFAIVPAINGKGYRYLSEVLNETEQISFFTKLKIETLFKTFLSYGFLPVLAPEMFPPILVNWWSRFSSSAATRHDLGMHYNAEIAPTLILATIYGWQRFKKILNARLEQMRSKKPKAMLISVNLFSKKILSWTLFGLAIFSLFFSTYVLKSPALLFTNRAFYTHTKNFEFLDRLIANIPDDGIVMAQTNIAGKLAYRKVYMLRNNYRDFDPDYIVIDVRDGQEPNNFLGVEDFEELVASISADEAYEVYYDQGEQLIYRKK